MHRINTDSSFVVTRRTDPKTLEEAKTRLAKNSNNSSKPPSSDPPWIKRPPKKEPTGRKQGGQPGHEGHYRKLVPPERVDKVENCHPDACENCARQLDPAKDRQVGEPVRHQVSEIPKVEAHVTEQR
ncbi:MAG: hypothetical protein HY897_11140 [Deltaproteobacteria bacterium]|nr:hypothetical protein [Deltaproteobacteria bacterium]